MNSQENSEKEGRGGGLVIQTHTTKPGLVLWGGRGRKEKEGSPCTEPLTLKNPVWSIHTSVQTSSYQTN